MFEQPIGAAQRMGFKKSGPCVPDLTDTSDIQPFADLAPSGEPEAEQSQSENNDLIELGSYMVGGSSGSGRSSATTSAESIPAGHVSASAVSLVFPPVMFKIVR